MARKREPSAGDELLRTLPAIGKCLEHASGTALQQRFGHGVTAAALREAIASIRTEIQAGDLTEPSIERTCARAARHLTRLATPEGRRAINATGILLHTGLGRSPLSLSAAEAVGACHTYTILEVDLESGERNHREARVAKLLQDLTGCEAATVVNNCAAATFLMLRAMASGREVVVSRGQLIEIGGSFRMPDVMTASGCILREVGTTNRTHLKDYREAINDRTGALLHVHPSNYRVRGFTGTPSLAELCELGREHNIPVLEDLGGGALVSLTPFGLPNEVCVQDSLRSGAAIICFSGDKLISGPQAGILCGTQKAVEAMRRDPFFRMFRPDKLTLAALEATLLHFVNGDEYRTAVPFYEMLGRSEAALEATAKQFAASLAAQFTEPSGFVTAVEPSTAYTGGGALPDTPIPSRAVTIRNAAAPSRWILDAARELRLAIPSVFARVEDGGLLFDMRTLLQDDIEVLVKVIPATLGALRLR